MGKSRYKIPPNDKSPYFLTCTVVNWIPLFEIAEVAQTVLDSLRFLISENRITLYGFVIMENHLHLLASASNLSKEIGHLKSYTARVIIDYLKENYFQSILRQLKLLKKRYKVEQKYQLWQEGTHPEKILDQRMLIQKLEYIHYNPVRKGYVDDPSHWRYSSYRNYSGQDGLLPIEIIGL